VKILTVLTYYYPHWTGLTAHAVRVAEGLAGRGHDVTVLTARHAPELARDERVRGVRVVRLQPAGRFSRGMVTPTFPLAAARLTARHDVVQIHTPLPEALVVAGLCRALGKPLVMTHHGDVVMPAGALNQALQEAAYRVLRQTAALAQGITSYSQDYADHSRLLAPFRDKTSCIYPPVEIAPPDPHRMAAWRRELGLDGKDLIGFAGRWVDEKGFDYLLEALPLVRERIPEAHLVFAGERHVAYEDTYHKCEPLIRANADHITFLGLLRDERQIADFYGMCRVFALPSRTDMMALTQVEAMLCGTPVVATDIPGARVVVRDTGYGMLVGPRDPRALADGLVEVIAHRERYAPTVDGVRRVFDTDRTLAQYEQALAAAVARLGAGARTAGGDRAPGALGALTHVVGSGEAVGSPSAAGAGAVRGPGGGDPQREIVPGVTVTRYRHPGTGWRALGAADLAVLDRTLGNEADMAYRRRARIVMDYLDLHDGERVLDYGCGMGFYLMLMGRLRRLDLVGFDFDVRRLEWAEREGVPATLVRGDGLSLPFGDGSFDKVLMSEVLEHVADDRRALAEVHRVLRPGGVLAISVPHACYPLLWDPINRVWTGLGGRPFRSGPLVGIWTNHERLYRPGQLVARVQDAGFAVEAVDEATHFSFPLIHFLVYGVGKPLLERDLLPPNLRDSADRFSAERNTGSVLNPINLGVAAFRAVDRLNDRPAVARRETFVNVCLKARRP
jgi:glycosyltransferase involved in cell wall biosynthesis/SAM-dependent methyltransferase